VIYDISEVFHSFQGEGCLTGEPATFIRLDGCSVGCSWCDTKYANGRGGLLVDSLEEASAHQDRHVCMSESELARAIENDLRKWAIVTGGEPTEQRLAPLVRELVGLGAKVALETSGTCNGADDVGFDWICVSPKRHRPPLPNMLARADEIKMPVTSEEDLEWFHTLLDTSHTKRAMRPCVQPISRDVLATTLCQEWAAANGWRLSVQMQKYLIIR